MFRVFLCLEFTVHSYLIFSVVVSLEGFSHKVLSNANNFFKKFTLFIETPLKVYLLFLLQEPREAYDSVTEGL